MSRDIFGLLGTGRPFVQAKLLLEDAPVLPTYVSSLPERLADAEWSGRVCSTISAGGAPLAGRLAMYVMAADMSMDMYAAIYCAVLPILA